MEEEGKSRSFTISLPTTFPSSLHSSDSSEELRRVKKTSVKSWKKGGRSLQSGRRVNRKRVEGTERKVEGKAVESEREDEVGV